MENLENIGLDCPCYDFGDCSEPTFDIGDFFPIGANNGKLTITVNGEVVGEFYADQSEDTTIDVDLNNYVTQSELEDTKEELEQAIADKVSSSELDAEATLREEEDTRLSGEIEQLGTELNAEVNARTQADTALQNQINTKAEISALTAETTNRENSDIALQSQIDAITSKSDIVDIVGTKAELDSYDTSDLGDKDIVKVLTDNTHDNAPSYYRWNKTAGTWSYVGSESVAYTKAEADDRFVPKTRTINNKALSANVTLTTSDLTNDSGYLTESDLTDYVKRTDYSTATTAGVVRDANCFLTSNDNGGAYAEEMSYTTYGNASDYNFIGKGTLENVLNGRKYLMPEYTQELPATGEENKLYLTPATEQPDVEASANGKEVELANASEGDLIDWTIKGDTEQASYSGKNLIGTAKKTQTIGSLTVKSEQNNIFTIDGTSVSGTTHFLEVLATMADTMPNNASISFKVLGGTCSNDSTIFGISFKSQTLDQVGYIQSSVILSSPVSRVHGQPIQSDWTLRNISQAPSKFISANPFVVGTATFTNFRIQVQIVAGTTQDFNFEPYVGGTASPNPYFPQEVKTVTGRNTVSVSGKNLFKPIDGKYSEGSSYETAVLKADVENGEIHIYGKTHPTYNQNIWIPVEDIPTDGTYTLSFNYSGTGSGAFRLVQDKSYSSSLNFSGNYMNPTSVSKTAQSKGVTYNWILIYLGAGAEVNVDYRIKPQFEKSAQATTYQPYHKQEVELNFGKNLFDKNNAEIVHIYPGAGTFGANDSAWSIILPVEPNTTYTYSNANFAQTKANDGSIMLSNGKPVAGEPMLARLPANTTTETVTFTTTSDTHWICFYYAWRSSDSVPAYEVMQIERGDKATSYAEYFEPIELCKLGDYQDRIYKDGNEWKIEKKTGKQVLSGISSESWTKSNSTANQLFIHDVPEMLKDSGTTFPLFSDKFGYVNRDTIYAYSRIGITNQTTGTGISAIRIGFGINSEINSVALVREWLSVNTPSVYYPLETPTTLTIANQSLIDQLNELETLATAKGYNLVTTDTPTIQPFLEFKYFRPDPTVTKDEWLWVENHYELLGGERRYTHNLSVNHHTAQGHWDYAFTVVGKDASHYTQLAQVAYYLFKEHAGLTIPVSGTYTEGNNIYMLTKISANSLSQVTIEMRKLSDGSVKTITTGAVPVLDTIS